MPSSRKPPAECPVCGADVPRNARSCPECGADERTGWDEEATRYDGLDLPDSTSGEDPSDRPRPRGASRLWWAVAALLTILLVYLTLFTGF